MRWWKRIVGIVPSLGIAGLIVAILIGIGALAYFAAWFPQWTGFPPPPLNAQGEAIPQGKNLWEWLQLLLVPVVLAVGGAWLTRTENRYALQLQERREQETRRVEEQRAQDVALQAYLDAMTHLLLEGSLRKSQPDDEVRNVARVRTRTVLRVLDGTRKATVIRFLAEGGLCRRASNDASVPTPIVNLSRANLEGADLGGAYLEGAELFNAYLEGADLSKADLRSANLQRAHLQGANLVKANLQGANLLESNLQGTNLEGTNLTDCQITPEQLIKAKSVAGAILPHNIIAPEAALTEDTS